MDACPFCSRIRDRTGLVAMGRSTVAFNDADPVSDGHVLVVPARHVKYVTELEPDEWTDLWAVVRAITAYAERESDGVNVGFNAGTAAGQTIAHAHVHVIPRFTGDVPDPRGGIRGVIGGGPRTLDP